MAPDFVRRWVVVVTLGECLGFAAPAVVGALLLEATPVVLVPALLAAGAVLAYAAGLLPSATSDTWSSLPVAAQVTIFVVLGAAVLATIGTAQWIELRHHLNAAGRWVPGTALAWAAALTTFGLISTPLWQEGQSVALRVMIGVFAGLIMAGVMAVITGRVMRALLRRNPLED